MAGNIDLGFDAKRAFGDQLPTVYVNFVDVSYGYEPVDPDSTEMRLSMDPENGTHIDGSFSIYFTKEADNKTNQEVAEWIKTNLDDLYLYSWISAWKSINTKVKESSLDLKELFYAMQRAHHSTFTNEHPAYGIVIEEMKDNFLNDNWYGSEKWSTRGTPTWDGTDWSWDDSMVPSREQILIDIDQPGTWAYQRFWGDTGTAGPWVYRKGTDVDGDDEVGSTEQIHAGISFMETYLSQTLAAFIGTDITSDYSSYGTRFNAIRIKDYIQTDGSNVRVEGLFDKDGDEIGVIIDLPIDFSITQPLIEKRLDDDKEIYIIAVVGRKVLNDMSWEPESNDDPGVLQTEFEEMNSTLFNSNFGDITYEHILTGEGHDTANLILANAPEDVFVSLRTNSPVDGRPIMSIDGTYHEARPVDQPKIVNTMNQILNKYGEYIDKDLEARTNIANLARILGEHGDSIDLLRRLQTYRKTYMQKSFGTSGKIYEAFKKLLYQSNQAVKKQPRLKKIQVVNNKVIDSRMNASNVSYVPPAGTGNGGDLPGSLYAKERASEGSYIPTAWAHMSRRAVKTIPIEGRGLMGEMAQYILEEGLPVFSYVDPGGDTSAGNVYGDLVDEYMGTSEARSGWVEYFDNFTRNRAAGNPAGLLAENDQLYWGAASDGISGDRQGWISPGIEKFQDTVVENKGIFFFDYEKAVQTHSKLSYVLTPWKIERYMGLRVPFDYYRVTKVELVRKEMKFLTNMDTEEAAILDEEFDTLEIIQTLDFDKSKGYPLPKQSTYSGWVDNERYGQPFVQLASSIPVSDFSTHTVRPDNEAMLNIGDYATDGAYQTRTDYYFSDYEASYGDLSFGGVERGMTPWGAPSGEFLMDQAKEVTAYVDADHVDPSYSYLKFVNFDAPLGYRDESNPEAFYSGIDESRPAPTGRLNQFRSSKTRGNYRVMTFEYRDYMDDDVAYYNTIGRDEFEVTTAELEMLGLDAENPLGEDAAYLAPKSHYRVRIHVEDKSLMMVDEVYKVFRYSYDKFIEHYYNLAIQTCSFNNINDQFNDFFRNGIRERYPNYQDQQWIRAPYIFNIARNVLFGTFSGADEDPGEARETEAVEQRMRDNAESVARLIGPDDGRLRHLNRFKTDFEKLLNIIKPTPFSTSTAPNGQRKFGAKNEDHPGGEFSGPVYTYHPVYDRLLSVAHGTAGTEVDLALAWSTDAAIENAWETATTTIDEYLFTTEGAHWPIDQPIYGDMFLSALHEWDYKPPVVELDYDEMYDFLENIPGLLVQNFDDTGDIFFNGYRGLQELPTTLEVMYGGQFYGPPGRAGLTRLLDDHYEQYYSMWLNQLILFAFIHRYHFLLEDGLGVDPYNLFYDGGHEAVWNHIKEVARNSARYSAEPDTLMDKLNQGLMHLWFAYSYATSDDDTIRLLRNVSAGEIFTSRGIKAIDQLMKPVIYYRRRTPPSESFSTLPFYDQPVIEYRNIEVSSFETEGGIPTTGFITVEVRDKFGPESGDDPYSAAGPKVRVRASSGWYAPAMPTAPSYPVGFVPREHYDPAEIGEEGDLYLYPGDFTVGFATI